MTPSDRAETFVVVLSSKKNVVRWDEFRKLLRDEFEQAEADAIQRTEKDISDSLLAALMTGCAYGKEDGIRRTREAIREVLLKEAHGQPEEAYFKAAANICMTVEVR